MIGRRCVAAAVGGVALAAVLGTSSAIAHPLGNFSVNHAHALRFTTTGIVDDAVVDAAEIPTAQAERDVDVDGNGSISPAELSAYADLRCAALVGAVRLTVDDVAVPLTVTRTSFEQLEGTAGLATSRLECRLEAAVDLSRPRTVELVDAFDVGRVGWRELTAAGDGVRLVDSPVPAQSTTGGLRNYPVDLLDSPLDVRAATFRVVPGAAASSPSAPLAPSAEERSRSLADGGPLAGFVDRVTGKFDDLVGRRQLTLGVGLIAVALAIVLGASHALLPGHGKTVMAAYIAGRQGTARDAIVVGATVTATHTGGVLVLGLALTISSSLAGETVLGWLGVTSGLLIAALGASLLIGSVRHRPSALHSGHSHRGHSHDGHSHHGHSHHGHHHHHGPGGHTHSSGGDGDRVAPRTLHHVHVASSRADHVVPRPSDADTEDSSTPPTLVRRTVVARRAGGSSVAVAERPRSVKTPTVIHRTQPPGHAPATSPVSRRALVGMGVAGGLVPSPSALIVLLSAIALGRTAFGILLVIGYGVGMAATLTAAGLLLVRVRDRYQRRAAGRSARTIGRAALRWQKVMPFLTAGLVLVVGLGLTLRSLQQLS